MKSSLVKKTEISWYLAPLTLKKYPDRMWIAESQKGPIEYVQQYMSKMEWTAMKRKEEIRSIEWLRNIWEKKYWMKQVNGIRIK